MAAVEYESSDFLRLSFNIDHTIYTLNNGVRLAFVIRSANALFWPTHKVQADFH